ADSLAVARACGIQERSRLIADNAARLGRRLVRRIYLPLVGGHQSETLGSMAASGNANGGPDQDPPRQVRYVESDRTRKRGGVCHGGGPCRAFCLARDFSIRRRGGLAHSRSCAGESTHRQLSAGFGGW